MVDVGALDPEVADQIAQLPMVEQSGALSVVFALVDGVTTDLGMWVPRDCRIGVQIEADRIIKGRRPNPARADEIAVNESTAVLLGVDIGDHVSIATMTPEQVRAEEYFPAKGPRLEVDVVGVYRGPDDLVSTRDGELMASPAMFESVHRKADEWTTYLGVQLRPPATTADFEAAVDQVVPPGQEFETTLFEVRSTAAKGTIAAIASGLAVFAIVAAIAAMVAVGQTVGRHVLSARRDDEVLGELGITRPGRRAALVLSILPVAVGGALAVGSRLARVADHASRPGPKGRARYGALRRLAGAGARRNRGGTRSCGFCIAQCNLAHARSQRTSDSTSRLRLGHRVLADVGPVSRIGDRPRARPSHSSPAGAIGNRRRRCGNSRDRRRPHLLRKPRSSDLDAGAVGVSVGRDAELQFPRHRRGDITCRHGRSFQRSRTLGRRHSLLSRGRA